MHDEKLEVINAQIQGVTKSAEKFRGELGKLIEMCKEVQKLEFVPKLGECACSKCEDLVYCTHSKEEPHVLSVCGNCAGK